MAARKVEFEIIEIDFKDFQNGIRLRNLRDDKDVERYFNEFSEVDMPEILKKNFADDYIKQMQEREKDSGEIELVIETLSGIFLGIIEIKNFFKVYVGSVFVTIPNVEKSEQYGIKAIDALIELVREEYLYDDLILSIQSRESERYIQERGCKSNIRIVSNSKKRA